MALSLYIVVAPAEKFDGYTRGYDSIVVAAPDEDTARQISPYGDMYPSNELDRNDWSSGWVDGPSCVTVKHIGTANEGTVVGPIHLSYVNV